MDRFRRYVALSFLLLMAQVAGAQNLPLQNLDETEFKNVVSDLSANFLHTSVSGAAPLGDIFGFEVGLIGGLTNSSEIDKLVKAVDADAKADRRARQSLQAHA